jgi:hypothetical protein
MRRPALVLLPAVIMFVVGGLTACRRSHDAFVAHGPLPSPPSGQLKFAGAWPEHPFHKEPGNVFERTVFQTDGPNSSRIEIRDLLIPPRTKSQIAALPGPAVLELATGAATILLGEKPESMVSGAMRSLPASKTVQVENPDTHPTMLRLYVIRAR